MKFVFQAAAARLNSSGNQVELGSVCPIYSSHKLRREIGVSFEKFNPMMPDERCLILEYNCGLRWSVSAAEVRWEGALSKRVPISNKKIPFDSISLKRESRSVNGWMAVSSHKTFL